MRDKDGFLATKAETAAPSDLRLPSCNVHPSLTAATDAPMEYGSADAEFPMCCFDCFWQSDWQSDWQGEC